MSSRDNSSTSRFDRSVCDFKDPINHSHFHASCDRIYLLSANEKKSITTMPPNEVVLLRWAIGTGQQATWTVWSVDDHQCALIGGGQLNTGALCVWWKKFGIISLYYRKIIIIANAFIKFPEWTLMVVTTLVPLLRPLNLLTPFFVIVLLWLLLFYSTEVDPPRVCGGTTE